MQEPKKKPKELKKQKRKPKKQKQKGAETGKREIKRGGNRKDRNKAGGSRKRVGVMTIETKKEGTKLVIGPKGRLDTTTAPKLEELLKQEIEGLTDLQMDFAGLEYISSAGLRVLLFAAKTMKGKDGTFVIRNVCKDIMEVLVITGFADKLTIEN